MTRRLEQVRDRPNFRGHRGEAAVDETGTVPFAAKSGRPGPVGG